MVCHLQTLISWCPLNLSLKASAIFIADHHLWRISRSRLKKNSEIIIPVPYDEIPPKKNIQKTLWFRKLEFLSFWVPSHGGYFIGDWIKARTHHKITSILGGWRPWHPTFHPMKNPIKPKSIPSHHIPSQLPSGKRLHSYGKSLFLMGKSTRNGHFQ